MYTTNIPLGSQTPPPPSLQPPPTFRFLYSLGVELSTVSNTDPCQSNSLCGHQYELVGRALSKGVADYASSTNTLIHIPKSESRILTLAEADKRGTVFLRSDDNLCFLWGSGDDKWIKTSVIFFSGFLPKVLKLANPNGVALPIHLIISSEVPLISIGVGAPLQVA